jgi:hypothetical protein
VLISFGSGNELLKIIYDSSAAAAADLVTMTRSVPAADNVCCKAIKLNQKLINYLLTIQLSD